MAPSAQDRADRVGENAQNLAQARPGLSGLRHDADGQQNDQNRHDLAAHHGLQGLNSTVNDETGMPTGQSVAAHPGSFRCQSV
jgi:hypothetical protein